MQVGAKNAHTIVKLITSRRVAPLVRDIVVRYTRVRQCRYHSNLVPALNESLADIRSIEGLWPIVLAGNKDTHYLAPSPVETTPSVFSMIFKSIAMERRSIYSKSSATFSFGKRS